MVINLVQKNIICYLEQILINHESIIRYTDVMVR